MHRAHLSAHLVVDTTSSSMAVKGSPRDESPGQAPGSPNAPAQKSKGKPTDYSSHGVTDNDIFLLPSSDFQLLGVLTAVAALVRLFRIYQPSSVVFDEVQ